MKRLGSVAFAVLIGAGFALSGCSSDGSSGGSGGSASSAASGGDQAKGKIGVILPDTKSSVRWESKDRPALEEAFKAAACRTRSRTPRARPTTWPPSPTA